jgi:hypothetical protein
LTLDGHDAVTAEGDDTDRLMVPERPKRLETVAVPVAEDPVGNDTTGALIAKSVTLTFKITE